MFAVEHRDERQSAVVHIGGKNLGVTFLDFA
jgi:hypothetical protein